MAGKIMNFFREYILFFGIASTAAGFFLTLVGIIHYWLNKINLGAITDLAEKLGNWNAYTLLIGVILLLAGIWYVYSFQKNKKFILEELKSNKRSEILKKHLELKNTVKHMPSKYRKMLKEKEEELGIK